jgi:hypothetical protein
MGPISIDEITNSFESVLISLGGVLKDFRGGLATKVLE